MKPKIQKLATFDIFTAGGRFRCSYKTADGKYRGSTQLYPTASIALNQAGEYLKFLYLKRQPRRPTERRGARVQCPLCFNFVKSTLESACSDCCKVVSRITRKAGE